VSLLDRIRRLWESPGADHPLREEERDEHRPETSWDMRGRVEEDFVGADVDPDEPRSGRL